MNFAIYTDTSANIPSPLAESRKLGIVPLSYCLNGENLESTDTESFDYTAYYTQMKDGAKITTSQINPQKYMDYMEPALKQGQDILFVGMSSGLSGSFSSAVSARAQLLELYPDRKIRLVDSLGASLGEGLLVLKGADCRDSGMSLDETADRLDRIRGNVYQIFTVDDLMHLRRGGRLSGAVALLGTLLNIKPILKGNEEGKIVNFAKTRGRNSVISQLAQRYDRLAAEPEKQLVGISHCGCPEDAKQLADLICRNRPPKDILIVNHEPVTGSYLGPGALALYFDGADDVRLK